MDPLTTEAPPTVPRALPEGTEAEMDAAALGKRARRSIGMLMARQVLSQAISLGGGVLLARLLDPAHFGLFTVAATVVGAFGLLSDFGLAPSFIQRKEELTEHDLQVGFTLQQLLIGLVAALLVALAPWVQHRYFAAEPQVVWLVRILAFNLLLASWRSMSALQLERHLKYDRLAWVELAETAVYYLLVVVLAWKHLGVMSLVVATAAKGIVGTVLIYHAAPWPVRFAWDRAKAGEILRYGLPFQAQMFTNALAGWFAPLLVGGLVGATGVGHVTWATSNGKKPLILTEIVIRVSFPHFSRLQDQRQELMSTLSRYLQITLLPACLWLTLLATAGLPVVRVIYTAKWEPAVPCLITAAASMCVEAVLWMGGVCLNSLGQVSHSNRVTVLRTVLGVLFLFPAVHLTGIMGVPLAYGAAALAVTPWMLRAFGKAEAAVLTRSLLWLLLPTGAGLLAGLAVGRVAPPSLLGTALILATTFLTFAALCWWAGPEWLRAQVTSRLRRTAS